MGPGPCSGGSASEHSEARADPKTASSQGYTPLSHRERAGERGLKQRCLFPNPEATKPAGKTRWVLVSYKW